MTISNPHLTFLNVFLPLDPHPSLVSSLLTHLPDGRGCLHKTQNACHPPVAGHDNSTDHPAASVVVRPRFIPSQRLADPLAMGIAATALRAAHTLVVQHGVDVHGVLLALETSLR